MTRAARMFILASTVLAIGLGPMASPVRAEPLIPGGAQPIRKLSRGLANAFGGVLEIPLTISDVGKEEGPLAGMTWGLFVGFGAAVVRTAVGVAEVLTFPFPLAEVGYGPMLHPEFLLNPENVSGT